MVVVAVAVGRLKLPLGALYLLSVVVSLFALILLSVLHVTDPLLKNAVLNGLRFAVIVSLSALS